MDAWVRDETNGCDLGGGTGSGELERGPVHFAPAGTFLLGFPERNARQLRARHSDASNLTTRKAGR